MYKVMNESILREIKKLEKKLINITIF
jgi:hypothetical protein